MLLINKSYINPEEQDDQENYGRDEAHDIFLEISQKWLKKHIKDINPDDDDVRDSLAALYKKLLDDVGVRRGALNIDLTSLNNAKNQ